jgi:hypothetical protein
MLILTFELIELNIIRTKKTAELSSINVNFDFLTKEIVDDLSVCPSVCSFLLLFFSRLVNNVHSSISQSVCTSFLTFSYQFNPVSKSRLDAWLRS